MTDVGGSTPPFLVSGGVGGGGQRPFFGGGLFPLIALTGAGTPLVLVGWVVLVGWQWTRIFYMWCQGYVPALWVVGMCGCGSACLLTTSVASSSCFCVM